VCNYQQCSRRVCKSHNQYNSYYSGWDLVVRPNANAPKQIPLLTLTKKRQNLLLISACFAGRKARENDAEKRLSGDRAGAFGNGRVSGPGLLAA
jgi:hypothetical protein